jgi:ubiquitin-protein ligase
VLITIGCVHLIFYIKVDRIIKMHLRRINKELDLYYQNHDPDIEIIPSNDLEANPELTVRLYGAVDTPYYGTIFIIKFKLTTRYPLDYPRITFNQPIYHPNVNIRTNTFCTIGGDDFKDTWSPHITIEKLTLSIKQLMYDANFFSCYNDEAAKLYLSDIHLYNRTVREWCIRYGLPSKWRQRLYIKWVQSHSSCILSKLPNGIVRHIIETYI